VERAKPLKSFERHTGTETPVGKISLTKQSFTDECDINKIMGRYLRTGLIEHVNPRKPSYGDFSGVTDYHEALELIDQAQEQFDMLPSAVRNLVDNSPEKLLQALTDETETAALAEAGLPMSEDYRAPQQEKAEPLALEEKGAEDSGAITGGE